MLSSYEAQDRWQRMSDSERRTAISSYERQTARTRARTRWLSLTTADVAPGSEPRFKSTDRQLGDTVEDWAL